MNMSKILTSIALILALTTTGAYANTIEHGKRAVKSIILNHDGIKFRKVWLNTWPQGVLVTCGEIKFKNGYGESMGWQRFLSAGSANTSFLAQETGFSAYWKYFCT